MILNQTNKEEATHVRIGDRIYGPTDWRDIDSSENSTSIRILEDGNYCSIDLRTLETLKIDYKFLKEQEIFIQYDYLTRVVKDTKGQLMIPVQSSVKEGDWLFVSRMVRTEMPLGFKIRYIQSDLFPNRYYLARRTPDGSWRDLNIAWSDSLDFTEIEKEAIQVAWSILDKEASI